MSYNRFHLYMIYLKYFKIPNHLRPVPMGEKYHGPERAFSGRTQTAGYNGPIARPFRSVTPADYYQLKTLYKQMADEQSAARRAKRKEIEELGQPISTLDTVKLDQNCKILNRFVRDNGLVRLLYRRQALILTFFIKICIYIYIYI